MIESYAWEHNYFDRPSPLLDKATIFSNGPFPANVMLPHQIDVMKPVHSPISYGVLRTIARPTFVPPIRTMATLNKSNEDLKLHKLFDVSKFTALVTGGGTGIGLMITQALATNGAKVYITGRREEALKSVVDQYNTGPGKIIAGDISNKDEVKRLAEEVASKESNGIHLLVNNGNTSAQNISDHMMQSEPQQWAETFNTNITAQYFMTAAFLPLLAKGREVTPGYSTSVVNISSISGVMKGTSMGQFAYATSKAGLIHLTRMMATTFVDAKIRVNCIAPGVFPSEMTAGSSGDDQKSELKPEMSNPAGRPGSDSDMAACILFLAGPGGLFMNAQILYPDGGNIIVQPAAT
ncbi:MAG: hypothetical protein Q9169_006037 [Polycauliona sp. 2 TL-2023]